MLGQYSENDQNSLYTHMKLSNNILKASVFQYIRWLHLKILYSCNMLAENSTFSSVKVIINF